MAYLLHHSGQLLGVEMKGEEIMAPKIYFSHLVKPGDTVSEIIKEYCNVNLADAGKLAVKAAHVAGESVFNIKGWAEKFGTNVDTINQALQRNARYSGDGSDIRFIEINPGEVVSGLYDPDTGELRLNFPSGKSGYLGNDPENFKAW